MKITIKPIKEAPNLQQLKDKFGVSEDFLIVAYGDAIYCPSTGMTQDLLVHETFHCERQKGNVEAWWKRYMEDEEFRTKEECMAYREQYRFCCKLYKDRNARARILHALAKELSSSMYGKIIDYNDAYSFIKS